MCTNPKAVDFINSFGEHDLPDMDSVIGLSRISAETYDADTWCNDALQSNHSL